MGLFDHLFKPKSDPAAEEHIETAPPSETPPSSGAGVNVPPPKPPVLPPPDAFGARVLGQIVTPGRMGPPTQRSAPVEARPKPLGEVHAAREIVLTLDDVLPRIPKELLVETALDGRRPLRFPLRDLAADIARGRAGVPLSQIAAQCPDIFRTPIGEHNDALVRLPLQKLVEQIMPAAAPPVASGPPVPTRAPAVNAPADARIHLSIAAILRTCPREIIIGELPPVGDTERVVFPFAPIERQLPSGRVDVSSIRFVAALPLHMHEYFRAIEGVRVPLPLDEIYQNLPGISLAVPTIVAPASAPPAGPASSAPAVSESAPIFAPKIQPPPGPAAPPAAPVFERTPINQPPPAPPPPAPAATPSPAAAPAPAAEAAPVVQSAPLPAPSAAEAIPRAEPASAMESQTTAEAAPPPVPVPAPAPSVSPAESVSNAAPPPVEPPSSPARPPEPAPAPTPPEPSPDIDVARDEIAALRARIAALKVEFNVPSVAPADIPPADLLRPSAAAPAASPQPSSEIPAPVAEPIPFQAAPSTPPAPPVQPPPPRPAPPPPFGIEPPPSSSPPAATPPAAVEPAPVTGLEPSAPTPVPAPIPELFRPPLVPPPVAPVVITTPKIDPPSPVMLPVRIVTPPPVRPHVAPPRLFSAGDNVPLPEVHPFAPQPEPEPPAPPPPPPPPPLVLDRASAVLGLEGEPTLARLAEHLAALPGLAACVLEVRHEAAQGGSFSQGPDGATVRALMTPLAAALADRPGEHITIFGEHGGLSVFTQGNAHLAVLHRARAFLPGIREKLAATAEALAEA